MEVQIEKGVPIPPKATGRNKPRTHPLWLLEVGDSYLFTGKAQTDLASRAGRISRESGRRFVTRKAEGGVRVWRIK